jgi:hypothetical protein
MYEPVNVSHGVMRAADGVITKFDVATAGTGVAMVRFLCKTTQRERSPDFTSIAQTSCTASCGRPIDVPGLTP